MKIVDNGIFEKIGEAIERDGLRVAAVNSGGVDNSVLNEFANGILKKFETAERIAEAHGFELVVSFVPKKNGKK